MTKDEIILAQQARIEQLKEVLWDTNKYLDQTYADLIGDLGAEWLAARIVDKLSPALSSALSTPDDLSALRAHDAELLAPYQWQPIETAPKDGEVILVSHIFNDQIYWVEAAKQKHGAWFRPTGHAVHQPTHWMPLPEMPR